MVLFGAVIFTCSLVSPMIAGGLGFSDKIDSIEEFLKRRSREAMLDIAKAYNRDSPYDSIRSYDVKWKQLWNKTLDTNNAWALSYADQTIVLAENRVLRVDVDSTTGSLTQLALVGEKKSAKFARHILWKRTLYLLIGHHDGACSLYVNSNDAELNHRQIVKHRGLPTDARFFTQENQLYLVVADNSGQFSVPSVIYRWTGSYMDVVSEVPTTGAVSVTTFDYKRSTILVFAQNVRGRPRIGSEVFEFTRHGSLEKIQFLPTNGPTSVHNYRYDEKIFLLVANELTGCNVYFWDGKEFINWMEIPEIKSPTTINVVYADGETFLVVAKMNTLWLYRIRNFNYDKLNVLEMKNSRAIVDVDARVRGKSNILLILVESTYDNACLVEPFELTIKQSGEGKTRKEEDGTWKHLTRLEDELRKRMQSVREAYESWGVLVPVNENAVVTRSLNFEELILEDGTITDLFVESPREILTPNELDLELINFSREIDSMADKSERLLRIDEINAFTGHLVVEGDAFFDELHLDDLFTEFVNDIAIDFNSSLSYSDDQYFDQPLRGKVINVQNLEIDRLCGIPFENWSRRDESEKTKVDLYAKNVKIADDAIFVESNLTIPNLVARSLNDVDLVKFFNETFIIDVNQRIKGNIFYEGGLSVSNMTLMRSNGTDASQFFVKSTDQSFGDFYVKSLLVDDLFADSINDVAIGEAARVDTANAIDGEVTVRRLRVTDQLSVDGVGQFSDIRPVQLYRDVEIVGNLRVKRLELGDKSSLLVNGSETRIDSTFGEHWTRSTNQIIANNVTLLGGISIDDLRSDYLNGYAEDEFLYATTSEISEKFGRIRFDKLETEGYLSAEGEEIAESSLKGNEDMLIVSGRVIVDHLETTNVNAEYYNGVPIDVILDDSEKRYRVTGESRYVDLIVNDRIDIEEARVEFVEDREVGTFFNRFVHRDGNYQLDYARLTNFNARRANVERLNGLEMIRFRNAIRYREANTVARNLTIRGDLRILEDLRVDYVNGIKASEYLDRLVDEDIQLNDVVDYVDFLVEGDLTARLFENIDLERLVSNSLLRSTEQIVRGELNANNIRARFIDAAELNGFDLRGIKLVTDPLIFDTDVNFDELYVHGDIVTGYVNGRDITEIYENALIISYERVRNLTIEGSLKWENENASSNESRISYLFENYVTKNTDQEIVADVTFVNDICALHVTTKNDIAGVNVTEIVSDTVESTGEPIRIYGEKVFARDLIVGSLKVEGNIATRIVNERDVRELNDSIVRKFGNEIVEGEKVFIGDVVIDNAKVGGKVHGSLPSGIVTTNEELPSGTKFRHLQIEGKLYARSLDDHDIERFDNSRVTLDGDDHVYSNVYFHDSIRVSDARVRIINDVDVGDAVYSGGENVQIITGEKIISKDLGIIGDVEVGLVNGFNLTEEHENGIFNYEDVRFAGDVVFSGDVEVNDVKVRGLINGAVLDHLEEDLGYEEDLLMKTLSISRSEVDQVILRSVKTFEKRNANEFFYLDEEIEMYVGAPNIGKVEIVSFGSYVKLNLYGTETGSNCGLPEYCDCPVQYVAELTSDGCTILKLNGTGTVYNFYEPERGFGLNVVSTGESTNERCTPRGFETRRIDVSWMRPGYVLDDNLGGQIRRDSLNVSGYLADAEMFESRGKIYLVLAIYYDPTSASYDSGTFVYELDPNEDAFRLAQRIPTSGAVDLDVFSRGSDEVHLSIACLRKPAESQLHRFDLATSSFIPLRTFRTGGSKMIRSLVLESDAFVLLDEPLANSIHVFNYRKEFDNYYFYQSLFHESPVNGIQLFRSGESSRSDAFVIVTTEEGRFFLYEYMYHGGFQLRAQQWLDGVKTMVPFAYEQRRYVFAGTIRNSTIYRIVKQGTD